jgi:Ca2+-transporting ATPase
MAFATLSFSELLRAFTSRSDDHLLLKIGLFSNRAMFYAVASSIVLLLAVIYLPVLQPIFDTLPLTFDQWRIILPLLLIPALVAELTKVVIQRRMQNASASIS